jgi:NAD(P)-dependent dehydrogenase (short-subunit alcohol dehydrogenase family)
MPLRPARVPPPDVPRARPARPAARWLLALLALVAPAAFAADTPADGAVPAGGPAPATRVPTVRVTGASRGIGYEIARQYADRGYRVIATARKPKDADDLQALARRYPAVTVEKLDVTEGSQVKALATKYRGVPIDILVNNAGILGGNERQKFGTLDYEALEDVMETNVEGPIRMVEAFVDNVAASDQKKLMNISSFVGSIERTFGGQIFYRASKAALNMSMRTLSMEFKRAKEPGRKELIVGLIDPGVVDTEFGPKPPIPLISAAESAAGVIAVIDAYDLKKSGRFFGYKGNEIPW